MSKDGIVIGIIVCGCVLLFALFKLTYCDSACESRHAEQTQRVEVAKAQVQRQTQEQNRLADMAKRNTSPNCPGRVIITQEDEQWRHFNPNHCAVMWRVLEGRLVLEGLYPWLHWEIWPGGNDPDIQPPWDVRSKSGVSKWQYILCENYTDQFHQAALAGRFECS